MVFCLALPLTGITEEGQRLSEVFNSDYYALSVAFYHVFLTTAIRKCFATHFEKQNGEQLFQIQP